VPHVNGRVYSEKPPLHFWAIAAASYLTGGVTEVSARLPAACAATLTLFLLWGIAFDWMHLVIMGSMIVISGLGITVGYHRLITHKAFRTPAAVRYLMAVAGSMAVQGPVIEWCAEHRRHHQHSDHEDDPHSPHMGAKGSWGEGLWATGLPNRT
jgi:fatty-acid desaturase